MTGETATARALTREMIAIFDEATTFFGIWARHGSRLNFAQHKQSADAASIGAERFAMKLRLAEAMMPDGRFLAGDRVTIADCVAMALLQFVDEFYGVKIPINCPRLAGWYQAFSSRPSVPHHDYPAEQLSLAYGLPEQTQCFV
jgi:glutathione S-transferase